MRLSLIGEIMAEYVHSEEVVMSKEHALKELKRMYDDIDKDNHLFIGTIPPEMIAVAIEALESQIYKQEKNYVD